MRRARRTALVSGLAAGLLLCAFATAPPVAARAIGLATSLAQINGMLADRASAQQGRNRARFAATIDPRAPAAFRDAQLRGYDGLAALPVAALTYRATAEDVGDLSPAVDASHYGGDPVVLVETRRSLTLDRYDDRASLDDLWWTYVQRAGRWYVGGDGDAADLGLESTVSVWDTSAVITVPTDHFLVIAHPSAKQRAVALGALAERAIAVLNERWKLPWSGRLVVVLPESPDELRALLQATVDVTKFVAFVAYDFDPTTLKPTAPRLYIQDTNLSQYGSAQQVETLVHELTHAAGSGLAGASTPSWLHEGLADWVAGGPDRPWPRPAGAKDHAPTDDDFGAGSQADIVLAYRDARSLIATLAAVAGHDAPFALFRALGADPVQPGGPKAVIDVALRAVRVGSLTELETKWVTGR